MLEAADGGVLPLSSGPDVLVLEAGTAKSGYIAILIGENFWMKKDFRYMYF
jgi:hypothetical protein